ncbi:hypothetical protein G3545_08695 [Starkeya sp. ORNL1]|uniref:hypothetical protein n=1 Tax=Starkeya sp. ORNL1 TaxID=2709380 RepID=UPI0014630A5B|nr:hypothetical protein [Starkeya sp. ORNL1]QJP12171.1 hypothetical protein G3545_08695 [Starkeya sp. ORNL1]
MTREEFLHAVRAESVRLDTFNLDNVGDECFVLAQSGYDWRVYYSERGLETSARHFATESDALTYLLEELRAQKRRESQWGIDDR